MVQRPSRGFWNDGCCEASGALSVQPAVQPAVQCSYVPLVGKKEEEGFGEVMDGAQPDAAAGDLGVPAFSDLDLALECAVCTRAAHKQVTGFVN